MGYMFRYQDGFQRLAEWSGTACSATSSACERTCQPIPATDPSTPHPQVIAAHPGGILFDLAGHMLDQVLWLLERRAPQRG